MTPSQSHTRATAFVVDLMAAGDPVEALDAIALAGYMVVTMVARDKDDAIDLVQAVVDVLQRRLENYEKDSEKLRLDRVRRRKGPARSRMVGAMLDIDP